MHIPMKAAALAAVILLGAGCRPRAASDLRCEDLVSPAGIEAPNPVFSWKLPGAAGTVASACRVTVRETQPGSGKPGAVCWDSGKIPSAAQRLAYGGPALQPDRCYHWQVRYWNERDRPSRRSRTASFRTGRPTGEDWQARWIGLDEGGPECDAAPLFRKEIRLEKPFLRATAYICGLGYYELSVNGRKISDHVLAPAVTNYDRRELGALLYPYDDQSKQRCLYNTLDLTDALQTGTSCLGIILGNGWYNQRDRTIEGQMWYDTPRVCAQIEVEYRDGSRARFCTDTTWKTATGGLVRNSIFRGEVYDARLGQEGWDRPGFDDSAWKTAVTVRPPEGELHAQLAPPDRAVQTLVPTLEQTGDHAWQFTLPYTVSGWARIRVQGHAGDSLRLRFFTEEGTDYGQEDLYILRGGEPETWEPRFTWHCFRRIEATATGALTLSEGDLCVASVHTDIPRASAFHCSDTLLNSLFTAWIRTEEANLHGSFSSDCPHRERLGYTGDGQVIAESALFSYDMRRAFRKWLDDIEDARNHVTGFVTHTAPFGGGGGGPAWGSAIVTVPWACYKFYGDRSFLEAHYDAMTAWVDYLGTRTDERGLVVREEPGGWCLGDWCTPERIQLPEPLVNTCYWYHCADRVAQIATLLGRADDARRYGELARKIAADFHAAYYHPETGHYGEGIQGADVFPLAFGMVPDAERERVEQALLTRIAEVDDHFDTGILATPLLLQVLTATGHADLAYRLLTQRTAPGYGYLLDPANSTLWERWDGRNSRCHPMFGSVVAWLFSTLGGIDVMGSDLERGELLIHPYAPEGLEACETTFETVWGTVRTAWKRGRDGRPLLRVQAPAGLRVQVREPACLPSTDND